MKRFLMDLFARHDWAFSEIERWCMLCGRSDMYEVTEDEFGEVYEWIRVDRGDARKHWDAAAPD